MSNSIAQQANISCINCQQPFTADIWIIIDIQERPDLLAQVRTNSIHNLSCPHCHSDGQIDAPLLIYRSDHDPVIIFSPAQQTTQQQDQRFAREFISILRRQLGSTWQDTWASSLSILPRPILAADLSDDPGIAMRQMREQLPHRLAELEQNHPETYQQLRTIEEFVESYCLS